MVLQLLHCLLWSPLFTHRVRRAMRLRFGERAHNPLLTNRELEPLFLELHNVTEGNALGALSDDAPTDSARSLKPHQNRTG